MSCELAPPAPPRPTRKAAALAAAALRPPHSRAARAAAAGGGHPAEDESAMSDVDADGVDSATSPVPGQRKRIPAASDLESSLRRAKFAAASLSFAELHLQSQQLLAWREVQSEEIDGQLDTSCLPSVLSTLPSSWSARLYACELSEESGASVAAEIDGMLKSTEGDADFERLIGLVCAWTEQAHANGDSGQRWWQLLNEPSVSIAPRNLVTACYLLAAAPTGVRKVTQFRAAALYLSVLELGTYTGFSLSTLMQEVVLRRMQSLVRAWARQDARAKEAGIQRAKKVKKSAAGSTNPFGDDGHGDGESAESEEDAAWLAEGEAAANVVDYLQQCLRLFNGAHPVLPLGKYSDVHSHLIDTLFDLTRTEIELTRPAAHSPPAASPPALAVDLLLALLHPAHGSTLATLQLQLKHLLSNALLSFGGGGAATAASVPRHLMPVHRSAIAAVRRLVSYATQQTASVAAIQNATSNFMQHLLLRAADRAEFRKLVTAAVVKDLLSGKDPAAASTPLLTALRASQVSFIARLSRNKRPAFRLLALELAEAASQCEWSLEGAAESGSPVPDPSSAVSTSFAVKLKDADLEEDENGPNSPLAKVRVSMEPRAAIDLSCSLLDESAAAASAEPEALPLAHSLLSVILARCGDASSSVRTKALSSLSHVLALCAQRYGAAGTAPAAQRAAFTRMLAYRLSPTALGRSGGSTCAIQRSVSAPLGSSNTPAKSFLHTPLPAMTARRAATSDGSEMDDSLHLPATPRTSPHSSLPAFHPAQAGVRDILTSLYRRSSDEKAMVRRAALEALECILLAATVDDEVKGADPAAVDGQQESVGRAGGVPSLLSCLTASDLQIFFSGCFDRSLSIRKQAMQSLTALLRRYATEEWPTDPAATLALSNLQRIWLGAVLPLIRDGEKAVVDKCMEAVTELLVQPIAAELRAAHAGKKQRPPSDASVWHLFGAMDGEMLHYFCLVLIQLLKEKQMPNDVIKHLSKEVHAMCSKASEESGTGEQRPTGEELLVSDRARACWVLLECACTQAGHVEFDLSGCVSAAWCQVTSGAKLDESSLLRLIGCVGRLAIAGHWTLEQCAEYAGYLYTSLTQQVKLPARTKVMDSSPSAACSEILKKQIWLLNALCAALNKLQDSMPAASRVQMPAWEGELLTGVEQQLEAFIDVGAEGWHEPTLHSTLFLLGELVLQHQSFQPKRTLRASLIQSLYTFIAPTWRRKQAKHKRLRDGGKETPEAAEEESAVDFAGVIQLSPSLRAHAFMSLGKCCLRQESLAKGSIALLIGELELGARGSPLVQNNILLILCDLTRTFTAIVDPYLPSITAMLAHPNTLLRKHTIMTLNVLLQEEYLKMRSAAHTQGGSDAASSKEAEDTGMAVVQTTHYSGSSSLFYRYLRCVVDEDASLRELVQGSLQAILAPKVAGSNVHGTRLHMHMVELIFFLNGCREHPLYNQFGATGKKGITGGNNAVNDTPFTLVGPLGSVNAAKRFSLYRYCLSLLTDEQKFVLMSKLHNELLQSVIEDSFLTQPWHTGLRTEDVVQDALLILASQPMQLSSAARAVKLAGGEGVDSVEAELQEMALAAEDAAGGEGVHAGASGRSLAAAHAQAAAKAKLLHKLLKKSTMESCLPVLFELRSSLAKVHSPLSQYLFHYLAQLLHLYKAEVDEVFAANPLLEREIRFDIRRWNQQNDEHADAHKQEQQKWLLLDFTAVHKPARAASTPAPIPQQTTRGSGLVAATSSPLKASSLESLCGRDKPASSRTPVRIQRPTASPQPARTLSTPAAARAAVAAALASPVSLRTPGVAATATPALLRRTHSTPTLTPAGPRAVRMDLGPAALGSAVESDVSTDDENDSIKANHAVVEMASINDGRASSSLDALRPPNKIAWKVAVKEEEPDQEAAHTKPSKKNPRTTLQPSSSSLESLPAAAFKPHAKVAKRSGITLRYLQGLALSLSGTTAAEL